MSSRTRSKRVLRWSPSPDRRLLTQYALAVSALIVSLRIALFPWSWRYVDDIYLYGLLWIVCVPSVLLLLFDFRRVFPPGHCQKCGYDLAGTASGVCSGCAERIDALADPDRRNLYMVRPGRKWRVLKRAGLISCLLIVLAGAVTAFFRLTYRTSTTAPLAQLMGWTRYESLVSVTLAGGELQVFYGDDWLDEGEKLGWDVQPIASLGWGDLDWVISGGLEEIQLALPLWILLVIVAIPTAFLFWRDRPIPPGHCRKCGYNLTGNVSGVCPECGKPVRSRGGEAGPESGTDKDSRRSC
jgi:hypothetical protein